MGRTVLYVAGSIQPPCARRTHEAEVMQPPGWQTLTLSPGDMRPKGCHQDFAGRAKRHPDVAGMRRFDQSMLPVRTCLNRLFWE